MFTEDFKTEAVRLSFERGLTIAEVASNLGIGRSTLTAWRRDYRGGVASSGSDEGSDKQVARLRREGQILKAERDLFKKGNSLLCSGDKAMKVCLSQRRRLLYVSALLPP